MSKRLEVDLRKEVLEYLRTNSIFHFRIEDQNLSNYPDLIMIYKGRFVAAELKRNEKTKARLGQLKILQHIRDSGGYGEVVGSLDQLKALLEKVEDDTRE